MCREWEGSTTATATDDVTRRGADIVWKCPQIAPYVRACVASTWSECKIGIGLCWLGVRGPPRLTWLGRVPDRTVNMYGYYANKWRWVWVHHPVSQVHLNAIWNKYAWTVYFMLHITSIIWCCTVLISNQRRHWEHDKSMTLQVKMQCVFTLYVFRVCIEW